MPIQSSDDSPTSIPCDYLCVGLFEESHGLSDDLAGTPLAALVARLIESKELGTSVGDSTVLHATDGLRAGAVLLIGLGSRAKFGPGQAHAAGFAAAKKLASKPRNHVAAVLPGFSPDTDTAWVEGWVAASNGPGLYKKEPSRHPIPNLTFLPNADGRLIRPDPRALASRAAVVGEAVREARELVNRAPSDKSPTSLARHFQDRGTAAGLKVEVWDEARLREERFGGLLGVAAGSSQPPAFVQLSWKSNGGPPALALVGKGVTFDSGGLSIKPSASMEDMKCDMAGAAAVFAAMLAAARLDLPGPIVGFLPLTENMTGGRAMKLGDVLTIRNGTTVEVLNTDAEGRLILADALAYAAESKPARIVDLATLTGACMVGLGTKVAGLFASDDVLAAELQAAAKATGERLWRLPLDDDYSDGLKSQVADLKNVAGRWGGAITAAKFLQSFTDDGVWAHLDIAGPAWAETDSPTQDAGGTGCFVRTLVRLIEQLAP